MVDSLAWKHVNDKWPTFATNACSIRLGLALDGVNPFGDLKFLPFYLANDTSQLQFASVGH